MTCARAALQAGLPSSVIGVPHAAMAPCRGLPRHPELTDVYVHGFVVRKTLLPQRLDSAFRIVSCDERAGPLRRHRHMHGARRRRGQDEGQRHHAAAPSWLHARPCVRVATATTTAINCMPPPPPRAARS